MKYMIAVPCMDTLPTNFVMSLFNMINASAAAGLGDIDLHVVQGSLIYDARDKLAADAISGSFDRVMWIDSDMRFDTDLMIRLADLMDTGMNLVSGLYISRKAPFEPVIYKELRLETSDQIHTPIAEKYLDYPDSEVFEIQGAGFGGVMTSVDLLRKVTENFGLPFFPYAGFGEDLAFCWRVKQLGVPMYCNSDIKLRHIGLFEIGEEMYRREP